MEEWKEYRLGDFMEFNPKISLKKDIVARKITMDQLVPHSRDIYSWTYEPYSGGAKFQNGDTIMARITPCLENGKHAFISLLDENEIAYGSTEYIVIRGRKGISDNLFVYYLTHFPSFKDAAIKSMVGTSGRQRAQVDVLENLTMKLPSIAEQKSIADILTKLDDKIAVNKQINDNFYHAFFEVMLIWILTSLRNDNLEQQAQALFKSWFIDFEPFRDQPFVESELGMIPKGWRVGTLSDLANITMGTSPSGTSYNVSGEGEVFYQGRAEFGYRFPHRNMFTTEPKRYAEEGEVLLSVRAPVGDVNIANERCCIGRGLAAIGSNSYPSYILYLVKSLKSVFEKYNGEGTVFGSINKKALEGLRIIVPENRYIGRFEDVANSLDGQIRCKEEESRRLASLRDTLLPKLMSGELTLNNVNM